MRGLFYLHGHVLHNDSIGLVKNLVGTCEFETDQAATWRYQASARVGEFDNRSSSFKFGSPVKGARIFDFFRGKRVRAQPKPDELRQVPCLRDECPRPRHNLP